jgi:hypothetical protein
MVYLRTNFTNITNGDNGDYSSHNNIDDTTLVIILAIVCILGLLFCCNHCKNEMDIDENIRVIDTRFRLQYRNRI